MSELSVNDYLTNLETDKEELVNNLNERGVDASTDETFTSLTKKVKSIGEGSMPYATEDVAGVIKVGNNLKMSSDGKLNASLDDYPTFEVIITSDFTTDTESNTRKLNADDINAIWDMYHWAEEISQESDYCVTYTFKDQYINGTKTLRKYITRFYTKNSLPTENLLSVCFGYSASGGSLNNRGKSIGYMVVAELYFKFDSSANTKYVCVSRDKTGEHLVNEFALLKNNTSAYYPTADFHPATKLYVDTKFNTVGIQFIVMPEASAEYSGKVLQYIGETTETFIKGNFYTCVSNGEETPSYLWSKLEFGTDLSNYYTKEETDNEITHYVDEAISKSGEFIFTSERKVYGFASLVMTVNESDSLITTDIDFYTIYMRALTKAREHYGAGAYISMALQLNENAEFNVGWFTLSDSINMPYAIQTLRVRDNHYNIAEYGANSAITITWNEELKSYIRTGSSKTQTFNKRNSSIIRANAVSEAWTPATDYSPVPKKYVDDSIDRISSYKSPNVIIVGEPTVQDAKVSNFTEENYLMFPYIIDFDERPFEIEFSFTTGSDITNQQNILDSEFGLALAIRNGKLVFVVSEDGTSWSGEHISDDSLRTGGTYKAKILWDTYTYRVRISTDGAAYYNWITFNSRVHPYPKTMYIGNSVLRTNAFKGSINLRDSRLLISNEVVWEGVDSVPFESKLNIDFSNINSAGIEYINSLIDAKVTSALESEY